MPESRSISGILIISINLLLWITAVMEICHNIKYFHLGLQVVKAL